jgi:hypothetical protein
MNIAAIQDPDNGLPLFPVHDPVEGNNTSQLPLQPLGADFFLCETTCKSYVIR